MVGEAPIVVVRRSGEGERGRIGFVRRELKSFILKDEHWLGPLSQEDLTALEGGLEGCMGGGSAGVRRAPRGTL
jgi:hypothetical protein